MRRRDAWQRVRAPLGLTLCLLGAVAQGDDSAQSPSQWVPISSEGSATSLEVRRRAEKLAADIGASRSDRSRSLSTARSANFSVTAPAGSDLASHVLRAAEEWRRDVALQWFDEELPASEGFTFIHVELCPDRDVGLALPAVRENGSHRIWLQTSRDRAQGTTLAHEVAHAVVSTRLSGGIPVWANEAIACQYDDAERTSLRQKIVGRFVRTGLWPSVHELLQARQIVPTDEISYAAAVSLSRYLLTIGDRPTFLRFVQEGTMHGWDAALEQHYQLDSIEELSICWRSWAAEDVGSRARVTLSEISWTALTDR
jgi:hypothetical protein